MLFPYVCCFAIALLALPAGARGFEEWCRDQTLDAATRATVRTLLRVAGTEDCVEAASDLGQRTELRLARGDGYGLVHDLRPVASLSNLEALAIIDNPVIDVAPLAAMTGLRSLSIRGSGISSVEPLAALGPLKVFDFTGNLLEAIESLPRLAPGASLRLTGNFLRAVPPALRKDGLRLGEVRLDRNLLDDDSVVQLGRALAGDLDVSVNDLQRPETVTVLLARLVPQSDETPSAMLDVAYNAFRGHITVEPVPGLSGAWVDLRGLRKRDVTCAEAYVCFATTTPEFHEECAEYLAEIEAGDPRPSILMRVILAQLGTRDCADAERRLEEITALAVEGEALPYLDTALLPLLPNLRSLRLYDVGDLWPEEVAQLSLLTRLEHLELGRTSFENAGFLVTLRSLRHLDLRSASGLTFDDFGGIWRSTFDVRPIGYLTNLTFLNLTGANVQTYGHRVGAALAHLDALTLLGLGHTRMPLDAFVGSLDSLEELYIPSNEVASLASLEGLGRLRILNASNNQIGALESDTMRSLVSLESLVLSDNHVEDASALAGLPRLERLYLASNPVSDVEFVRELPALTTLDLAQAGRVHRIEPLAARPGLLRLSLAGNPIEDFSPLASLTALRELYVQRTGLSSLKPLANLAELSLLNAGANALNVLDADVLAALVSLRELYVQDNALGDITSLDARPELTVLNVGRNPLSDVTPVASLRELRGLYVKGLGLTDVAFLRSLERLERLDLSQNEITDASPLASLTRLTWLDLRDNPLAEAVCPVPEPSTGSICLL